MSELSEIRHNKILAAIAQQVERILGKDEVSSSNLDSSSTKKPETTTVSGFLVFCAV